MMRHTGIFIACNSTGATDVDHIQIGSILLDHRTKLLLERRAREEGITLEDAFEKTLVEALHEHVENHNPREWWSFQ